MGCDRKADCHNRWLRFLVGILVLLGVESKVRAGYTVTGYSSPGNTITIVGPNGVAWHQNYAGQPPTGHGGGAVSANPPAGNNGYAIAGVGSVSCEGQITATIAYSGDANARPESIILKETATAYWGGSSGNCNNGLGGTPYSYGDGQQASSVKYTVINNPGLSLTKSCSPYASGGLPVSVNGMMAASAGVSYKVEVFEVKVTLDGVVQDTEKDNILVGQSCRGNLTKPAGVSYSNYSWTVGGLTFDSFARGPNDEWGHVNPIPTGRWNEASPTWTWRKEEEVLNITCSAQASVNGQSIGTVTGKRKIQVWTPYHLIFDGPLLGTSLYEPNNNVFSSGSEYGIMFSAAVGTQNLFRVAQGAGTFHFIQLANMSHQLRPFVFGNYGDVTTNGQYQLDNGWPYYGYQDATSTESFRVPLHFSDAPQTGGLLGRNNVTVLDQFKCYLMYQPPGNGVGTYPVTLHRIDWKWDINAYRPVLNVFGDLGPWTPTPPGSTTVVFEGWSTEHPVWQQKYVNSGEGGTGGGLE